MDTAPFGSVVSKVIAAKKEEAKVAAPTSTNAMGSGTFPWNKKPAEDKPVTAAS